MSNVIAEATVLIRPRTDGFAQDATSQVNRAMDQVQRATQRRTQEARITGAQAVAQFRAESAALRQGYLDVADGYREMADAENRVAGIGGRGGGVVKGLIGAYAIGAALDGYSQLQKAIGAIAVQGDKAYTSAGRMQNGLAGVAQIATGRPFSGIATIYKAFVDDRPAKIASSVAAAMQELKAKSDPLVVTEERLIDVRSRGTANLAEYVRGLAVAGAVSLQEAKALYEVGDALYYQQQQARAAADAIGMVSRQIAEAGSEAAAFGERVRIGGVEQEKRTNVPTGPSGDLPDISTQIPPGIRAAIERERGQNDKDGLIEVLKAADVALQKRLDQVRRRVGDAADKTKNEISAAIADIRGARNSIAQEIAALAKPDDPKTSAFQLPIRFLVAQDAADETPTLQDDLKVNARIIRFLEGVLARTKTTTDKYRQVLSALGAARSERNSLLNGLAAEGKDKAADRRRALLDALGITEQKLQIRLLEEELKDGLEGDRGVLRRMIAFYAAQSRNMKLLETERLNYRAKALQTRARLKALKDPDAGSGTSDVFGSFDVLKMQSALRSGFANNIAFGGLGAVPSLAGLDASASASAAATGLTPGDKAIVDAVDGLGTKITKIRPVEMNLAFPEGSGDKKAQTTFAYRAARAAADG